MFRVHFHRQQHFLSCIFMLVIASHFLGKVPLQLWEARKALLVAENSPELHFTGQPQGIWI